MYDWRSCPLEAHGKREGGKRLPHLSVRAGLEKAEKVIEKETSRKCGRGRMGRGIKGVDYPLGANVSCLLDWGL